VGLLLREGRGGKMGGKGKGGEGRTILALFFLDFEPRWDLITSIHLGKISTYP